MGERAGSIVKLAQLCAQLDDLFAERHAVLLAHSLTEATLERLLDGWSQHLEQCERDVEAMARDGRSVSSYADKTPGEDFAESVLMYALSKGTPCEATARAIYPARYAFLEERFGGKFR